VFEGLTADALVESVRPDVYVKGSDWTPETLPESETVRRVGARVEFVPYVPGQSTRALLAALAAAKGDA